LRGKAKDARSQFAGFGVHWQGHVENVAQPSREARKCHIIAPGTCLHPGADCAGRFAHQEAGQKAGVGGHRVGDECSCHGRLHHQVNGQPPPVKRRMSIARAGAPYRVALPKGIERGQRLLPVFGIHGVPAQELPAFIRE